MTVSQDHLDQYSTDPKPKNKGKAVVGTITGVFGLLVGIGMGSLGQDPEVVAERPTTTHTVTATPEPAPTVTKTAEPEVRTETKEVPVEVTPQSCLVYIGLSEEAFTVTSEFLQGNISEPDAVDYLNSISDEMLAAKQACRTSAGTGS